MKIYQHHFYILFLLIALISGAACSTTPTTPINENSAVVVNSNIANTKTVANTAAAVTPANVSPIQNAAASPSATVAAYYQSMVKKDEMAFRKVLSMPTLKEFSAQAKEDGEKTLVGWYTGFSSPPKQPYETRNERMSGDVALVELKDGDTGRWSLTKLVRENGEWKLDLTGATVESLLKQQPKQ